MDGMEILHYPDPRLTAESSPLGRVTAEVLARVEEMFRLMYEVRGIGLAAPQVGWPVRLVVADWGSREQPAPEVWINPAVIRAEGEETGSEGCLSFPGLELQIARPTSLRLKFRNLEGKAVERTLEGLPARVAQHEMDHLDGLLMIQRVSPARRIFVRRALRELEKKFREAAAP